MFKDFLKATLRAIGRIEPDIPKIRAIHNRLLKPIFLSLCGDTEEITDVLGFKMKLRVRECVDGNLFFAPHLYDRKEINYAIRDFPLDGIFIDLGAYKGFWSLYFASKYPNSTILAIEANPTVFEILVENIKLNGFSNIVPINYAVADEEGEVEFFIPNNNNLGGSRILDKKSFYLTEGMIIRVKTKTLLNILLEHNIKSIDLLKIDIEGYEMKVLKKFFESSPARLYPKKIVVEYIHNPEVDNLISCYGYKLVFKTQYNSVFVRGE
jgi:FkbM family methyltransferase